MPRVLEIRRGDRSVADDMHVLWIPRACASVSDEGSAGIRGSLLPAHRRSPGRGRRWRAEDRYGRGRRRREKEDGDAEVLLRGAITADEIQLLGVRSVERHAWPIRVLLVMRNAQ